MSARPSSPSPPPVATVPLELQRRSDAEMRAEASAFFASVRGRRSVRHFSDEPVPLDVVEQCIAAAGTAPSGANKQPWTFVLVTDRTLKRAIREAAEEEERAFYAGRAGARWLDDLAPLGVGPDKPFLEVAPVLIVVFAQRHGGDAEHRNYYVTESVGIAVGILLTALHRVGLATLTHTPSPMKFLREVLGRPANEQALMVIPVGHPADGCEVPAIERKELDAIVVRR